MDKEYYHRVNEGTFSYSIEIKEKSNLIADYDNQGNLLGIDFAGVENPDSFVVDDDLLKLAREQESKGQGGERSGPSKSEEST